MPTKMAVIMPKNTPVLISRRASEPGPDAKISGNNPKMKAIEVMMMGRKRSWAALSAAGTISRPAANAAGPP